MKVRWRRSDGLSEMAETRRKRKAHSDVFALPEFVEPMQAKLVESLPSGDWIYEIKFDGYPALALRGGGETRVLSRNEKDWDASSRR
jgi:bifunctional non-homologous end joining protein LigD